MIGSNRLCDVIHQHRFSRLWRRHDQATLPLAKRSYQIDHARGNILSASISSLHGHALVGMQRCQVLESNLVTRVFRGIKIDLIHLKHGEITLAILRRSDLARNGITGAHVETPYLAGRHVDIIRSREVGAIRRS